MTALIVCMSVSHGNTRRVADVMGEVLGARVVAPDEVDPAELSSYDIVGFGSGIFNMSFHPDLLKFVDRLPDGASARAFVFCTSGFPEPAVRRYTHNLSGRLASKGYDVIDVFSCRSFDTWWPFKPFGGIHKDRPNDADLDAARAFARRL